MSLPQDNALVSPKELPPMIYNRLVMLLGENEAWLKVAERISFLGIFQADDMIVLRRCEQPAERLLQELSCRLCDVATLCKLLDECCLYNVLMLFKPHEPSVITLQPIGLWEGNRTVVRRGYALRLSCQAQGFPPPSYQWYCDYEILVDHTKPDLVVHNFNVDNEGDYYCTVLQEGYESITSDIVIVNLAPEHPEIVQQPHRQVVCPMRAQLLLTVKAQGHPKLSYQWYRGDLQLDGHTSPDLKIENLGIGDEGEYRCYIHNIAGEVWSDPSHVTVYVSPEDMNDLLPRPVASAKVALLIANQEYENMSNLGTPIEDVRTLAEILSSLNFQVLALQNLSLVEMRNVIKRLCQILPPHAYVVFYFAGHGFELKDKFMLPVSAPDPKAYMKKDAVSEGELLRDVLGTHPQVFLELLDMCLKSPAAENKAIYQEVSVVHEYAASTNLIQGYSTTSYLSAYEKRNEKNGLYVKYLKKYLKEDIPIVAILANVGKDMEKECSRQMPYRGTNVTKEFRLTDPCEPAEEVRKQVELLNKVPDIQILKLDKSGLECLVTCYPYLGFCNALQVFFPNLQAYSVTCDTKDQELRLLLERQGTELVITVMNLQRMRKCEALFLELKSRSDGQTEFAYFSLGKPMIAIADLWFEGTVNTNELEQSFESSVVLNDK